MNNSENKKIALVTGANSGMGKATATALAKAGMHVVMLCRNKERGEAALADILEKSKGDAVLMLCDLADISDIKRFCGEFKSRYEKLDVLVNNAGVMTLDRRETKDGLELQFGVNHIGHFLLTLSLLELMQKADKSRIVVVTSSAHKIGKINFDNLSLKKGYFIFTAYGRAKLCTVLFTKELARRLKGTGVTVNCVNPGVTATNMVVDRRTGSGRTIKKILKLILKPPEEGARTAVFLASSPQCEGISGEYFYKCKPIKSSKYSHDAKLAQRLWELSENIAF